VLLAVAVFINVMWALSYPVSKLVMDGVSVGAMTSWRVAGAALLLLPFLRRHDFPERIGGRDLALLVARGLVGFAAPVWLQYMGTVRTTASNVSLIVGLETVAVVVLAALCLKERVAARAWAGLVAAVAGVGLISVDPATLDLVSGRYWAGNALMMVSILGFASYSIVGKLLGDRWSAKALTVLPLAVAAVVTVPLVAATDPVGFARGFALSGPQAGGVFFITAIATAFSYMAWNWALAHMNAGKLAYSLYVQPVAGALFSAWLLHEALTPLYLGGAALIGVAMVMGAERAAPAPAPTEPARELPLAS
jgi:drug/metabolite transporter (DMT)-like permease